MRRNERLEFVPRQRPKTSLAALVARRRGQLASRRGVKWTVVGPVWDLISAAVNARRFDLLYKMLPPLPPLLLAPRDVTQLRNARADFSITRTHSQRRRFQLIR